MDRKEIREWYKLLEEQVGDNKNNLIDFMNETFGADAGEQMKTIIKEENLVEIDNMKRKLESEQSEVNPEEVFTSKTEIKEFIIREEDKIWE